MAPYVRTVLSHCPEGLLPSSHATRSHGHAGPLLATVGLLAACSGSARLEPPAVPPFVLGPVASITPGPTGTALVVRAGPDAREPCGIVATVSARTRVLRRSTTGGAVRPADVRDVRVGDTVEVYVDVVAESCPAQGVPTMLVLRQLSTGDRPLVPGRRTTGCSRWAARGPAAMQASGWPPGS